MTRVGSRAALVPIEGVCWRHGSTLIRVPSSGSRFSERSGLVLWIWRLRTSGNKSGQTSSANTRRRSTFRHRVAGTVAPVHRRRASIQPTQSSILKDHIIRMTNHTTRLLPSLGRLFAVVAIAVLFPLVLGGAGPEATYSESDICGPDGVCCQEPASFCYNPGQSGWGCYYAHVVCPSGYPGGCIDPD